MNYGLDNVVTIVLTFMVLMCKVSVLPPPVCPRPFYYCPYATPTSVLYPQSPPHPNSTLPSFKALGFSDFFHSSLSHTNFLRQHFFFKSLGSEITLALCSRNHCWQVWGAIRGTRNWTWLATCKISIRPTVQLLQPSHKYLKILLLGFGDTPSIA